MATIKQLSEADIVENGDQFPFFSEAQGDTRKVTFATLKDSVATDFVSADALAAQTGATLVGCNGGTTVQQELNAKVSATLDTDGTLAANSDARVASQKATKTYVDAYKSAVAASSGSSLVGHIATGAGAVARTVQAKLRETISVKDFGAVGNGVTDDTVAIQAAIDAAAGGVLSFGDGLTFLISATLNLRSDSIYSGSSKIKAAPNSISGALLDATGESWVVVAGLEIDANAANLGAMHGIQLSGGSNNVIRDCHIHDTLQAGIRAETETSLKIIQNRVIDCGRNGYSDNHGIMAYATSGTISDVQIVGNTVSNAFRKGITTYSAAPGLVRGVVIEGNSVIGCGLGGIYTGNAPGGNAQQEVTIVGNRCFNNYVNIEAANLNVGAVVGNVCSGTTGGQGVYSADCLYTTISANSIYNSQADGIKVIGISLNPIGITISSNTVALSSQAGAGTYDGIDLNGVTYSTITGNVILGEVASPKQGYGIQESGSSNFNLYSANRIANTHTGALTQFVGADNSIQSVSGGKTAINAATPNNTLDINGGLSIRDQGITVSNGANDNVALPSGAGTLYTAGPSAAYNISGIAGGASGRKITLINYTNQVMTINHNSGSSSAGNRILIGGSADIAISSFGAVELVYVAGASAWFVVGVKA